MYSSWIILTTKVKRKHTEYLCKRNVEIEGTSPPDRFWSGKKLNAKSCNSTGTNAIKMAVTALYSITGATRKRNFSSWMEVVAAGRAPNGGKPITRKNSL